MKTHVLVALRRKSVNKNENVNLKKLCHRMVVRSDETVEEVAENLKKLCWEPGTWRMYRTVNRRDLNKAMVMTQVGMLEHPESYLEKVDGKWKSNLMKEEVKAERKFLLDLDTTDLEKREFIFKYLTDKQVEVFETVETPNGFHFVTEAFDTRDLESSVLELEVKRDDLFFLFAWDN